MKSQARRARAALKGAITRARRDAARDRPPRRTPAEAEADRAAAGRSSRGGLPPFAEACRLVTHVDAQGRRWLPLGDQWGVIMTTGKAEPPARGELVALEPRKKGPPLTGEVLEAEAVSGRLVAVSLRET
jgi:hypothetical protein